MTARKTKRRPASVEAWAYMIRGSKGGIAGAGKWHLCRWAQPFRAVLLQDEKPSDEARAVRVRMTVITPRKTK